MRDGGRGMVDEGMRVQGREGREFCKRLATKDLMRLSGIPCFEVLAAALIRKECLLYKIWQKWW